MGIEHALVAALRPPARRRDVSVARLVYDLLGMIAADGLVTAILDDDHPLPARRGAGPLRLHQFLHVNTHAISLSDEQLRTVMELATPIPVQPRDAFLRELAGELRLRGAGDVGPGELHRLCASRCGAASCPGTTALGGTASTGNSN